MAKALVHVGGTQFFDNSGDPLAGGKVYTYEPGTTTNMATYQDAALVTPHANPIVLDAYGRPPSNAVWLSGETKFVVKTSADVTLFTLDNINPDLTTTGQFTVASKSDDYIIVAADSSKLLVMTAAGKTFSTTDAIADLGNGFNVFLQNTSSGLCTFNPQGSETVQRGDGTSTTLTIPPGWGARVVSDGSSTWYAFLFPVVTAVAGRNHLVNGSFQVAQRGTSFTSTTTPANSDDTYLLDQWILLSDGNDVVDVTQNTTAADIFSGAYAGIKLDIETEDKKAGILQILDARRTAALFKQATGKASLSFYAKTSDATNLTKIRAGVLAWSGTADAPTSDVVSAWGAEGTNPTLVANWTFENTPAALADLTASVQRFTIENIDLDTASTANLAVFIWLDDMTNNVANTVTISAVKLEAGAVCTPYEERSYSAEYWDCLEYLWRQNSDDGVTATLAAGSYLSTTSANFHVQFPRQMRAVPTMSVSNVADFQVQGSATEDTSNLVIGTNGATRHSARLVATTAAQTDGDGAALVFDNASGRFIQFGCEL